MWLCVGGGGKRLRKKCVRVRVRVRTYDMK